MQVHAQLSYPSHSLLLIQINDFIYIYIYMKLVIVMTDVKINVHIISAVIQAVHNMF